MIHGTGNLDRSPRINRTARTRRTDSTRTQEARDRTRGMRYARSLKIAGI